MVWICNHMPNKVWDEIIYPFPNFNGCTVEVWEWINNFIPNFIMDVTTYPCWDVSQMGPRSSVASRMTAACNWQGIRNQFQYKNCIYRYRDLHNLWGHLIFKTSMPTPKSSYSNRQLKPSMMKCKTAILCSSLETIGNNHILIEWKLLQNSH